MVMVIGRNHVAGDAVIGHHRGYGGGQPDPVQRRMDRQGDPPHRKTRRDPGAPRVRLPQDQRQPLILDETGQGSGAGLRVRLPIAKGAEFIDLRVRHRVHPRDHRGAVPDRAAGPCHQRTLSVARPIMARISEMIQKRITMVDSAQPFFS